MAFTYAWTNIADSAIDPDSPIDTALMTAIRNNIVYVYEYVGGKSYTPAEPHTHNGTNSALIATVADGGITEPKLAASAASQSKLKTTQASYSTQSATGVVTDSAAGEYGFWPQVRVNSAGTKAAGLWALGPATDIGNDTNADSVLGLNNIGAGDWDPGYTSDTGVVTRFTMARRSGSTSEFVYLYQRYVQASPPYNLGNGEIPVFLFGLVDNVTGKIETLWRADDPPWANNGPTVINPLERISRLAAVTDKLRDVARNDELRAARSARLREAHRIATSSDPKDMARVAAILDAPITQAEKQRDMPLIPHPFTGNNNAGKSIVLLDPCGKTVEELWLSQTYGGDDINEIIHGGYIDIDNTPCDAISPPGVMAVGCRWKLTP